MVLDNLIKINDDIKNVVNLLYIQHVLAYENVEYVFVRQHIIFRIRNEYCHMKKNNFSINILC